MADHLDTHRQTSHREERHSDRGSSKQRRDRIVVRHTCRMYHPRIDTLVVQAGRGTYRRRTDHAVREMRDHGIGTASRFAPRQDKRNRLEELLWVGLYVDRADFYEIVETPITDRNGHAAAWPVGAAAGSHLSHRAEASVDDWGCYRDLSCHIELFSIVA
jgi:hypothetical protein